MQVPETGREKNRHDMVFIPGCYPDLVGRPPHRLRTYFPLGPGNRFRQDPATTQSAISNSQQRASHQLPVDKFLTSWPTAFPGTQGDGGKSSRSYFPGIADRSGINPGPGHPDRP